MELKRLNPGDPERIFMLFRNSYSTASMTAGQWAAFDLVTDQDGVGVTKPAGFNRAFPAGVATAVIASGSLGLFQVWGFSNNVRGQGGSGFETSKLSAGKAVHFLTSGFGAQAFANNTASLKDLAGKRPAGFAVVPTNTAAIATQAATSGQYTMMITCL